MWEKKNFNNYPPLFYQLHPRFRLVSGSNNTDIYHRRFVLFYPNKNLPYRCATVPACSLPVLPISDALLSVFVLRQTDLFDCKPQSLVKFHYLPPSCAFRASSDPGHYRGNGPSGPEGDAFGQGRSSSVVSDENCRVSGTCDL